MLKYVIYIYIYRYYSVLRVKELYKLLTVGNVIQYTSTFVHNISHYALYKMSYKFNHFLLLHQSIFLHTQPRDWLSWQIILSSSMQV